MDFILVHYNFDSFWPPRKEPFGYYAHLSLAFILIYLHWYFPIV